MKLIRNYDFSLDDFYNYLEKEITTEASKSLNQNISVADIKGGLKYTVHSDKTNVATKVDIKKYSRNNEFCVLYQSMGESVLISYITQKNTDGITITMKQDIQSYDSSKHNKITNAFNELIFLRRMQDQLNKMAQQIQKNLSQQKS